MPAGHFPGIEGRHCLLNTGEPVSLSGMMNWWPEEGWAPEKLEQNRPTEWSVQEATGQDLRHEDTNDKGLDGPGCNLGTALGT